MTLRTWTRSSSDGSGQTRVICCQGAPDQLTFNTLQAGAPPSIATSPSKPFPYSLPCQPLGRCDMDCSRCQRLTRRPSASNWRKWLAMRWMMSWRSCPRLASSRHVLAIPPATSYHSRTPASSRFCSSKYCTWLQKKFSHFSRHQSVPLPPVQPLQDSKSFLSGQRVFLTQ